MSIVSSQCAGIFGPVSSRHYRIQSDIDKCQWLVIQISGVEGVAWFDSIAARREPFSGKLVKVYRYIKIEYYFISALGPYSLYQNFIISSDTFQ